MRQLRGFIAVAVGIPAAAIAGQLWCLPAKADTLDWALAQAYQNNPSLNAQRAVLRATDQAANTSPPVKKAFTIAGGARSGRP